MTEEIQVISSPIVDVTVTSSVSSFASERRFQRDLTIGALKAKLEVLTGASCASMKLEVFSKDDKFVCLLLPDDSLLGSYHVDNGMRIHVTDTSGSSGQFEDVSKVEKFELSKEEYENRSDSVRAFKKKMKLGAFADTDPEEIKRKEQETQLKEQQEKEKALSIKVEQRCEVKNPGQGCRRGTVMYVGTTDFQPGYWIGVQYDEPLGKNNGSVKGRRYFECPPKYGGFVKPDHVTVGDFPEDINMEDEEM